MLNLQGISLIAENYVYKNWINYIFFIFSIFSLILSISIFITISKSFYVKDLLSRKEKLCCILVCLFTLLFSVFLFYKGTSIKRIDHIEYQVNIGRTANFHDIYDAYKIEKQRNGSYILIPNSRR